ncbi:MAG TPA: SPOR domain-containing protein [Caldimonas sp.]|nr:SPOR domain-containing protein [Caldimonas sp.]
MKAPPAPPRSAQRGGFLIGLVVGLLIGLAAALAVALYVTKAPNPFVNKVPARTTTQDAAEAEKNRNWDPNSALAGRNPAPGASGVASGDSTMPAPVRPPVATPASAEPVAPAVAARPSLGAASSAVARASAPRAASQPVASTLAAGAFTYFVQAGAYSRSEDAEQQRAKLAMLGVESRLTEREQAGKMVYRVRVGPFERREDAENAKERLGDSGVDSALVAVQK